MTKKLRTLVVFTVALVLVACTKQTTATHTNKEKQPGIEAQLRADAAIALIKRWPEIESAAAATNDGIGRAKMTVVTGSPSDFQVIYIGLICHAKLDENAGFDTTRRSLLVAGNKMKPHVPLLILKAPSDATELKNMKQDLQDATNIPPQCNNVECSVDVTGINIRVRGDGGVDTSLPNTPFTPDAKKSFDCMLPHLKSDSNVASGSDVEKTIPQSLRMPDPPAPTGGLTATFDIEGGGTLEACPFAQGGFYPNNSAECLQFAKTVKWTGTTSGQSVLQLRSAVYTANQWKTIRTYNTGILKIGVSNEPPAAATPTSPSSLHVDLYDQLMSGGHMQTVTGCIQPTTICRVCSGPTSAVVAIPGCSDSTYP